MRQVFLSGHCEMLPSSPSNDIALRVSQMPSYTIHWHHSYAWKEPYHPTGKSALCLPERKKKVNEKAGGGQRTYWYLLRLSCLLSLRGSPGRSLRCGRGWGPSLSACRCGCVRMRPRLSQEGCALKGKPMCLRGPRASVGNYKREHVY